MGLAILGVVVLLFILLAYLGITAWEIWQIVLIVFVFLAACGAFFLTAATMKTQGRWRKEYTLAVQRLDSLQQAADRLRNGSLDPPEPSLQNLRGEVGRVLIDRGRVWRNLRLAEIGQGELTLDASNWGDPGVERIGVDSAEEDDLGIPGEPPAEEGAEPAAAEPVSLGMNTGAIVYAFKELAIKTQPDALRSILYQDSVLPALDEKGLCKVPAFYMGEYKVTSDPTANPGAITLEPTLQLSPSQIEQLQQQDEATWVLYEVMPVDSHEALQGLTEEQLKVLLPKPEELAQQAYDQLINEYVRDQTEANDTDPPERKWLTVKFLKDDQDEVVVDVQPPTPLPPSAYDGEGRAIAGTLQQNAGTKFKEGLETDFDFETAQELIKKGIAEQVKSLYKRPLRDYAEDLRIFARQFEAMERQLTTAQNDLSKLNESLTGLREQIAYRSQQRKDLTEDRDGFNRERQVITKYRALLDEQWNALRRDLSRLYRANKQIVREQMTSSVGRGGRDERLLRTRSVSAVH